MNILLIFSGFLITLVLLYEYRIRLIYKGRNKNKVHFYVARDKTGELYLYLGKPFRGDAHFYDNADKGVFILACSYFLHKFSLNEDNYANLKWEDGPIEVFVNMED